MIAYQTDSNGVYIGEVECQLSPLDVDETWLIPAGAVTKSPPKYGVDQFVWWNGKKWIVEDIPTVSVVEETPVEETPVEETPVEETPVEEITE